MKRRDFSKAALATLVAAQLPTGAARAQAIGTLKMMIPANPGGGWDMTGRTLASAMQSAKSVNSVQFDNKGGAAGTLGLAQFINSAKGDPSSLMVGGMVMIGGILLNKSPVDLSMVTPVARLTSDGATWVNEHGKVLPLEADDILIVAPYNAQVARLAERLAGSGARVGTVDRFQGQEAPVVIYSMATSSPEDAPRGMEFLYDLHRLNVATSRARCAVFVVCSPRLLEPECRTPRQMHLANALCRYREMSG